MIEISLPGNHSGPLYMQLYRHIRELIHKEALNDGTRLPSVRSLQLQTNLSKITIETAYQMLQAEGYVISKPRSGFYVVNPYSLKPALHESESYSISSDISLPVTSRAVSPSGNTSIIDFHPATVDYDSFPTRSWRNMVNEVLTTNIHTVHQYGDPQGEYGLRTNIAQYLKNSRGVVCTPEQIVVGSGIQYSVHILSKLLGDISTIAFEDPGYAPVRDTFIGNGFTILPLPIQDKGLSVTDLEKLETNAVYVTPSHQFPTGRIMPYTVRQQLLNWAYNRNAYIIEDDYDGEFRYSGRPIPCLQGLDRRGAVIYIGTFSKVFSPGLRINYMVLPIHLSHKLASMEHVLSSSSRIDQLAMQLFMERGHWYKHIRRMRNVYRKKHRDFLRLIHEHFANQIQIMGESAGLHIELTVNGGCSVEELVRLAAAEDVLVYGFQKMWFNSGSMESITSGGSIDNPKVYLGFGGISMNDMELGIQRLKKAWDPVL
ncbi:PLP-dependent aminotransferase family protein [Cohnella sp.]|uniref:MocR-like pyridoxine biosynthesis transcription factor PdxR n=1 Tax=Cohnella sp. TaxID=1883426 RepID=UPI00356977A4